MLGYLVGAVGGYLLGSLNPAAWIARQKRKNLRKSGTGNLGATNVMLHFGKALGALVMLFDMAKAAASFLLAAYFFPRLPYVAMVAGVSAVVGHVFPFYLKFQGGKGLAAFAGLVLAYNPWLFLFLLVSGVGLMIVVNYSFILPYYAGVVFVLFTCVTEPFPTVLLAGAITALLLIKHAENIRKAREGTDVKIREQIRKIFSSHRKTEKDYR